jgi:transposase
MTSTSIPAEEKLRHLESHYADRVAAFRQRLAQIGLERVLIVLLDIGKNAHWITAHTAASRELVRPYKLPSTQAGLREAMGLMDKLILEHAPKLVILGHEPTGVYHEPWARVLQNYQPPQPEGQEAPQFEYKFFNPYQVKLARMQAHLRHRKTDPRDLAAMFDLALRGLGQPAFLPTGVEMLVRQEVGFIHAQARLLDRMERQLRPQLDRLWPNAVINLKRFHHAHPDLPLPTPIIQTSPLQRQRLRILLAHCPNPYDLVALSDEQILALFRKHKGRAGPALLNRLHAWMEGAVLLPLDIAEPLADQLQRLFLQYVYTETLIEEGRGRLMPLIPHTSARHLSAIPGLGDYDAACYLAGLGSVQRFFRAAEVWAFAGFDPIADGSGDHPDRVGHLSKRGGPTFRDTMYRMGYRVTLYYVPLGLTFLDAYERGKCEIEATLHATHRLNRICFHLMQHDEPFVDQTTPAQRVEHARRWKQFQAEKKRRAASAVAERRWREEIRYRSPGLALALPRTLPRWSLDDAVIVL